MPLWSSSVSNVCPVEGSPLKLLGTNSVRDGAVPIAFGVQSPAEIALVFLSWTALRALAAEHFRSHSAWRDACSVGVTFRVCAPPRAGCLLQSGRCCKRLCAAYRRPHDEQGRGWLLDRDRTGEGRRFLYGYYVVGNSQSGYKHDLYARELKDNKAPDWSNAVRKDDAYSWHDADFVTREFPGGKGNGLCCRGRMVMKSEWHHSATIRI